MCIDVLNGLELEGLRIYKGAYTFEFAGMIEGNFLSYLVSTSYNLSDNLLNKFDALENSSSLIWPFLHQILVEIIVGECSVIFRFDNGKEFIIWQEEGAYDNLLVIRDNYSDKWFTVL